jgi:hypothetical protein
LFPEDPVLGEIDFRWPGVSLSRCELAAGLVCPGCVAVLQVSGQRLVQVVLSDDQRRPKSSRPKVPMILSQMALALGACGGLARILRSSAVNTASTEPVNCLHAP